MHDFLNRKVPTAVGLTIIIIVAILSGWLMIDEYKKLIEMRFDQVDIEINY